MQLSIRMCLLHLLLIDMACTSVGRCNRKLEEHIFWQTMMLPLRHFACNCAIASSPEAAL